MSNQSEKNPWEAMLFPDPTRNPYYIVAPGFTRLSAGIRVLHSLCHLLNLHGQSAYVCTDRVNPDLVTPILNDQIAEEHFQKGRTPIVVYPETFAGNPLESSCVARYILNYPGLLGGPKEFDSTEFLFWYSSNMREDCGANGPVVSIPAVDARRFSLPPPGTVRHGTCFHAHKYKLLSGEPLSPITSNSIEILSGKNAQSQDELLELFQKSEFFYCYESSSLCLEAALCGCPVVLIPSRYFQKPVIVEPIGWSGVAWGNSPDQLKHAVATVGDVRVKFGQWVASVAPQLKDFIDLTQDRAANIAYTQKVRMHYYRPTRTEKAKRLVHLMVPPIAWSAAQSIKKSLRKNKSDSKSR